MEFVVPGQWPGDGMALVIGHGSAVSLVGIASGSRFVSTSARCGVLRIYPRRLAWSCHRSHALGAVKFDLLGNQNQSIATDSVEGWDQLSEQTLVLRDQGTADGD
jgi:hypothetical protein